MCAEKGVKRIMFTSSGGTVYGNRKDCVPITEDDPTLPVSPYGIAKLAAENYLRYFKAKYGVEYMVFRLSNPYGERQPFWRRQGVIAVFLDRIMKDEPIEILGDGTMVRDYIYVKDAANMMVRAFMSNPKHEIYNIGSGDGVSVNDIAKIIEKVTSTSAARQYEAMPPTFVHTSVLNIDRYVKEFSFGPEITIHEGIKKACKYYAIMQR
jgi:UDP-glucose 4-epimerase